MCFHCNEKHLSRDCPYRPLGHEWSDSDSDLDMQEPAGQEPAGVDVPVPDSPSAEAMSDPGPSHLIPSVPDEAVLAAPLDVAPSSPAALPPPFPDLDCHQGSGLPPEQPQPLSLHSLSHPSSASASYSSSPAGPRQGRGLGDPYPVAPRPAGPG